MSVEVLSPAVLQGPENLPYVPRCLSTQSSFVTVNLHTEFKVSGFTHSKNLIGSKKFLMVHWTLTTPFSGVVIIDLGIAMISQVVVVNLYQL